MQQTPSHRPVDDFPLGAHLVTPRRWYTHHGIYVGAGQVVHYQGLCSSLRRGPVERVSLCEFAHGNPVHVHGETGVKYSDIEVVDRACSRLCSSIKTFLAMAISHVLGLLRAGS